MDFDIVRGGAWIRGKREQAFLSLRDLQDRSGVGHQVIATIERGHNQRPDVEAITEIGRVLGFTADDFAAVCEGRQPTSDRDALPEWNNLHQLIDKLDTEQQKTVLKLLYQTGRAFIETLK